MYSEDIRAIALRVYRAMGSLREAAVILCIGKSTLHRWSHRITAAFRPSVELTPSILKVVKSALAENPFYTVKDLVCVIQQLTHTTISKRLATLAIKKCGYTRKRSRAKTKCPTGADIDVFKNNCSDTDIRDCIFIDETSMQYNDIPKYGYALKGERLERIVGAKKRNVTLTLAMTIDGIKHFETLNGSSNTEHFLRFLQSMGPSKTKTIVMDNVRFHHSKAIKDFCHSTGVLLLYTPPYSPDFNPIENVFAYIKSMWRRSNKKDIEATLKAVPVTIFRSCVERARRFWGQ